MSRDDAIERSRACYDDDGSEGYYARLEDLVAVKTESQNPGRLDEHDDYAKNHITPALERLGDNDGLSVRVGAGRDIKFRRPDQFLPVFLKNLCCIHGVGSLSWLAVI